MSNIRALTPDRDLRPAWLTSELFPFQSRFVDVGGARVHYVDEGSGPVLLMWGDKDPVFEFLPRFQGIYPRARTMVILGAHHFPFAEAPDEMIAEIRNWWTEAASMKSEQKVS